MKCDVGGISLSYEYIGDGYPIVLLHGWGANKETFRQLANHLKEKFRVYIIDLPGFGESEIGLPLGLYDVADIIHEFVIYKDIKKPIILGHSYGGRIAIIYASKYEIEKLILVASAGIKKRLSFDKRIRIRIYKLFKKCGIKLNMGSKDYINSDNVKKRMLIEAVNTDLCEEMKKINCETLLIYGDNDKITPIDIGKKIEANIPNSTLITLEECGHFLYLEKPYIFYLILDSFISKEES